MKNIFTILFLTIILSGCIDNNAPSWFNHQGINITECGPTVASNAINWAGGSTTRYETRKLFKTPLWWNLSNIYSAISRNGINVKYEHVANIDIIKQDNISGIFYINRSHFINVDFVNGKWISYDPLYGISTITKEELLNKSYFNFIAVFKY